ncbi:hypothetical protein KI387_026070 [Taxus chinensis]|uniref:Pentatricopeptide repeat-containing protein n=1 Tax=Taxus chinensis TaxID=29808 RepID=A0AA38FVZ0_TAXCH|nr:hypothetical protein KI387_026070 [Taxus chinensis]
MMEKRKRESEGGEKEQSNSNPSESETTNQQQMAYNPMLNPNKNPNSLLHFTNSDFQLRMAQTPLKLPHSNPSQYPLNMSKEEVVSWILKNPPLIGVDVALEELKVMVTTEFVEGVLKLSYGAGLEALRFFKWASWRLNGTKHTAYAWNLLVDLLGKEKLFDAMWGCIKVMKTEGLLSMGTFSSVFGNYVSADKIDEATMTFEVMEKYGCPQDVVALNCLLSAICRYNQMEKAQDLLDRFEDRINPDADTYAVLMEGWETKGNVAKSKHTFLEMIARVGWVTSNTSAYNAFLNTLINDCQEEEALKLLNVMKSRKCFPDLSFFYRVIHGFYHRGDMKNVYGFWEMLRQSGIRPDSRTYDTMIDVFCSSNEFDSAYQLLDEMVFNGVFPNSKTYNSVFEALISKCRIEEASSIFREMTKNDCYPLYANYVMAIKMYLEADDPEMATTIWRHMILKGVAPKADCASILIGGFCDLKRVSVAWKYCEEAVGRGIQLPSEIMRKLKDGLAKEGNTETYKHLENNMSNDGGAKAKSDPKNTSKSPELILENNRREFARLSEPPQKILKKLLESSMITLPPRPATLKPAKIGKNYDPEAFCDYHGVTGHVTNRCIALRRKLQDLIDSNQVPVEWGILASQPNQ